MDTVDCTPNNVMNFQYRHIYFNGLFPFYFPLRRIIGISGVTKLLEMWFQPVDYDHFDSQNTYLIKLRDSVSFSDLLSRLIFMYFCEERCLPI